MLPENNSTLKYYRKKKRSMADWSQLPKELLLLISEKLNSELYLLRFRSVCSTWRSSSIPNHRNNNHNLPLKLLSFPNPNNNNASSGYLIRHNIFLIKPPIHQRNLHPWMIRIGPKLNGNKTRIWKPIDVYQRLPYDFPNVIDSNQLSVVDIGFMFDIIEGDSIQNPFNHMHRAIHKKVVASTCHAEQQPIVIVTYDYFGQPVMFRCGDISWRKIPNLFKSEFGDICVFKGRPCVVDNTGLTVMIRPDLSVCLVADPLFSSGLKSLVESECELLLVERFFSDSGDLRIDVFRLDEKEMKWVKLTSLGDRVLFLADVCSFSVSASDLGVPIGNCVIFNVGDDDDDDDPASCEMIIFHLDQGQVSLLSDYFKLFWPPPKWIVKLHS